MNKANNTQKFSSIDELPKFNYTRVNGTNFNDRKLYGDHQHNIVQGMAGDDFLYGGEGHDIDILVPGSGRDIVLGSQGQDLIVYEPQQNADGSLKPITVFIEGNGRITVDENGDGKVDDYISRFNSSYAHPHSLKPTKETHDRIVIVAPSNYQGLKVVGSDQASRSNTPSNNGAPSRISRVGGTDGPVVGPNQTPIEFLMSVIGTEVRTVVSQPMLDSLMRDAGVNSQLNLLREQSSLQDSIDFGQQFPASVTVQAGLKNQVRVSKLASGVQNSFAINEGLTRGLSRSMESRTLSVDLVPHSTQSYGLFAAPVMGQTPLSGGLVSRF